MGEMTCRAAFARLPGHQRAKGPDDIHGGWSATPGNLSLNGARVPHSFRRDASGHYELTRIHTDAACGFDSLANYRQAGKAFSMVICVQKSFPPRKPGRFALTGRHRTGLLAILKARSEVFRCLRTTGATPLRQIAPRTDTISPAGRETRENP